MRTLTPFEKRVYRAVSKIPAGEARTYKWVALKAGRPRSYRAVGNALNKNPFPGIVPCHRVIRSDGSIGGFARGTKAKRALLKHEGFLGKIAHSPSHICVRKRGSGTMPARDFYVPLERTPRGPLQVEVEKFSILIRRRPAKVTALAVGGCKIHSSRMKRFDSVK
ncbi:MAG: hypothetical protein AUJ75_03020 [Candidatus Omnitrophica bacterium CG1_02_49_10]|nr:MAG: hypothetical protein AUJ75_03020 [Candidatus Omnitrophica bacterium CG1_02_49_10]